MIKIAICDDEVTTLHQTKECLKKYSMEGMQIFEFQSGEALIASAETFEMILLDIDMEGMNGIETAKRIRERDKTVKIIYLTNYADYITFAFAVHAFAYLLKPVKTEELFLQLDEALEYMQLPQQEQIEWVTEEGIVRLKPTEIHYMEYLDRKVFLHTTQGVYTLHKKITQLAEELKNLGFQMPHKSFVVNLYAVKRIVHYELYLTDGSVIPLSQKKSAEFRRELNRYLSKEGGRRI